MEDEVVVVEKYGPSGEWGFFSVYDGHGGRMAVEHVKQHLHNVLLDEAEFEDDAAGMKEAPVRAYTRTDQQLRAMGAWEVGSTAVTCVLMPAGRGRVVVCANAGDSRAVLVRGSAPLRLSYDHKATDKAEGERVVRDGGKIMRNRVNGLLAVTRAFGDYTLKDSGVTASPSTTSTPISEGVDSHLLIASDGVWDVVTDEQAVELIRSADPATSATELSKMLVENAMQRGSGDNICALVIKL